MKLLSSFFLSQQTPPQRTQLLAILTLLAVSTTVRAQTPASFSTVSTYSSVAGSSGIASGPNTVAVADVNGDGLRDIVTNNLNTVGVLLGQAAGRFGAVVAYSTGSGSGPKAVAVADVNGDGRSDIVTANANNSTAGVLLGQAGGGFATVSTYSSGTNSFPFGVAVADVSGDGRPDIVTCNSSAAGVLLGQAGGGFAPASTYSTGVNSDSRGIAVADVNGDGRPDIVTANYNTSTVGVLLGQVGGSFTPAITYSTGTASTPQGVAIADMNGDGRLDIVTANTTSNTAGVLLGQAGGVFAAVSTFSAGGSPYSVAISDVNGDGRPDIVTANDNTSTVGVLLGQASGGFAAVTAFSTGANSSPQSVAVADVNGDRRPDIVTANSQGFSAGVLLNTGTYTPLAATPGATTTDVTLFPNPAHGSFAVRLLAAWGAVPVRAELRNALGQVVAVGAAPAGAASLPFATTGLAPGVYGLRLQAGSHTLTKRVVLE